MALFERDQLPSRSALSRFLAALTEAPIDALRTLLREAARQRALPQTDDLPPPFRRLDEICAPGYRGRKRGQVVRTRTTISQAHSYQWLGSFGNRGNGRYREELRQGLTAIGRYLTAHQLEPSRTLLRLDGQYGTGAVLVDLASFAFVTRGKEYSVLDHPLVQARLHLPPDQFQQRTAKPDGAQPLRLPGRASRIGGGILPRGGGNASRRQKEESRWRHARGRRLRTLLYESATAGVHCF